MLGKVADGQVEGQTILLCGWLNCKATCKELSGGDMQSRGGTCWRRGLEVKRRWGMIHWHVESICEEGG